MTIIYNNGFLSVFPDAFRGIKGEGGACYLWAQEPDKLMPTKFKVSKETISEASHEVNSGNPFTPADGDRLLEWFVKSTIKAEKIEEAGAPKSPHPKQPRTITPPAITQL